MTFLCTASTKTNAGEVFASATVPLSCLLRHSGAGSRSHDVRCIYKVWVHQCTTFLVACRQADQQAWGAHHVGREPAHAQPGAVESHFPWLLQTIHGEAVFYTWQPDLPLSGVAWPSQGEETRVITKNINLGRFMITVHFQDVLWVGCTLIVCTLCWHHCCSIWIS